MKKRLYLSREDKKLAGVCGGIAEYFDIDSTLIRLLWVLLVLSGGGIFIYIAAAIIMTEAPRNYSPKVEYDGKNNTNRNESYSTYDNEIEIDERKENTKHDEDNNDALIGGILVLIGIFFLSRNFLGWYWFNLRSLTPLLLIGGGTLIILKGRK